MNQANFIGNLTADAVQRVTNGNYYITFTIARNEKRQDGTQVAQYIECIKDGDNAKLLPYLKKGTQVFVSGKVDVTKPYLNQKLNTWISGLSLRVRELQLIGGGKRETSEAILQNQQPQPMTAAQPTPAQPQAAPAPSQSLFGAQPQAAPTQPQAAPQQPFQQDFPF